MFQMQIKYHSVGNVVAAYSILIVNILFVKKTQSSLAEGDNYPIHDLECCFGKLLGSGRQNQNKIFRKGGFMYM